MFDIKQTMKEIILQDENLALPVVTVKALVEFTRNSRAKTYAEYLQNLNEQTDLLKKPGNPISYHAGIDLFISFVAKLPFTAFDSFKRDIIHGAELMIDQCEAFRNVCADNGIAFIKDNSSILIHSYSRLVLLLLLKASKTKHFQVYVTSASPRNSGYDIV
jgi:translation initiation factor eIF-2B subunit alpha